MNIFVLYDFLSSKGDNFFYIAIFLLFKDYLLSPCFVHLTHNSCISVRFYKREFTFCTFISSTWCLCEVICKKRCHRDLCLDLNATIFRYSLQKWQRYCIEYFTQPNQVTQCSLKFSLECQDLHSGCCPYSRFFPVNRVNPK